jgi:fucose permease
MDKDPHGQGQGKVSILPSMNSKRIDIATALAFIVYSSSVVITPLSLLKMSEELSFTLTGGGALEAGRAFLLLIALFISGKAASYTGKSRAIGLGLIVTAASLILAGFARTYWGVMSMLFVIGFGTGFAEALINPLVNDAHPENPGKYLNIINAFFSLGVVFAVLISGFLLTAGVSWRMLFIGLGIVTLFPAALLLSMGKTSEESGSSAALSQWIACLRQPAFWILAAAIFFGAASEAAFTFWSASYIQLNFKTLPSAAGIGTAFFAGAMFIGRLLAGKLTRGHRHDRRLLLAFSFAGIVISIAAYAAGSIGFFYLFLFAAGLIVAPYWPTIQAISPAYVKGDPTLLFILLSTAGIPGFGMATWLMGIVGDRYSLHRAMLLIPVFFILLSTIFLLLRRFRIITKDHAPAGEAVE